MLNVKDFLEHVNRKKFKTIVFASLLVVLLLVSVFLIPTTFSRYVTNTTSNAEAKVAFYLLKTDYQTNVILLDEIAPRNNPYTYTFTVSNYNGEQRTETNMQYDLVIRTTTNLPLEYELYLNSVYTDANAENAITDSEVIQDSDGTYFNKFTTDTKYFSYSYNEVNTYQLVVYFPEIYVDEMYQDIVDSIEITVNSKQIISDD